MRTRSNTKDQTQSQADKIEKLYRKVQRCSRVLIYANLAQNSPSENQDILSLLSAITSKPQVKDYFILTSDPTDLIPSSGLFDKDNI